MDAALLALLKKAKNKYTRSGNSVKLKEGQTTIRIVSKGGKFWAENGVHWIKTEANGKPVAVTGCYDEVHQQPCEVCAAIDAASKSASDDETLKIIKEWKMKKSVLVNALIRSGPDKSEMPQVVELTPTAFSQILNTIELYANEPTGAIDILDLKTGVDFVVTRSGKGFDTNYSVTTAPRSAPVSADVLDKLVDLDAYIQKEFFRGEDRKALTAIANMTGISVGSGARVAGPARAGLLTGPGGSVADAEEVIVEEAVAELEAAPPVAPAMVEAPKLSTAAVAAPVAAKPTPAPAAKPAPVAAAPATPAGDFGAPLPASEVDAMLAELDGVKAA